MYSVVKDGYKVLYSPTMIEASISTLPDGVYNSDGVMADAVETRIAIAQSQESCDGTPVHKIVKHIMDNLHRIDFRALHLPKMTKATSTALIPYPICLGRGEGRWYIVGYGLHQLAVDSLRQDGPWDLVLQISSGILAPLMKDANYELGIVKNFVILKQGETYYIANTIKEVDNG